MRHVITSCLKKNCCGVFSVCGDIPVLSLSLTKIDSASSVPTLKSFKDIPPPPPLFVTETSKCSGKRNSTKQSAFGLMTVGDSGEGASSSALRDRSECPPLCTGLWQILISSSAQPPHSATRTTRAPGPRDAEWLSDTEDFIMQGINYHRDMVWKHLFLLCCSSNHETSVPLSPLMLGEIKLEAVFLFVNFCISEICALDTAGQFFQNKTINR